MIVICGVYVIIKTSQGDGGAYLDNTLSISQIVKRYIKMRRYTIQEVAQKLEMNYKTFDGILNRNAIDAKLLFQLANLLDIDLCWMAQLYEKKRPISFLEQYQMTRMNHEMRQIELKGVMANLDRHIASNPLSLTDVKNEMLRDYPQLFYLLDVLLPETYVIRVAVERNREKYYCLPINTSEKPTRLGCGRSATTQFFEGQEMLKQIIFNRKAELEQ